MSNKFLKWLLHIILLIIQIGLIIAVFVVNYLTGTKAGVYRHIYTRRMQYAEGIYSPPHLLRQSIIAACIGILFIFLFYYAVKKGHSRFYKVQIALASLLSFFVIVVIQSGFFINMMAYPYIIMVFEIILVIQIIVVIIWSFYEKQLGRNRIRAN
ncbi:hypothetical protein V7124_25250 [Neobacillus niacini]|uniref:hypothetical protein n=1 Tax=Neobacillus niacini TaxID=86668 RepID=UPI002FFFD80D